MKMKHYNVGIIGATGMVGQRFATLLENHPWFTVTALASSGRSAGQTYAKAVEGRWKMKTPLPASMADMVLLDATNDIDKVAEKVDFVFCAVNMPKAEIRALEEAYAKKEVPVVSNNSAHRGTPDVPMVVPETMMDAPATGCPSSAFTTPETFWVWAHAAPMLMNRHSAIVNNFLPISLKLLLNLAFYY